MRARRFILIGTWVAVSLLAVAGFAAFSSQTPGADEMLTTPAGPAAGMQVGAVAAMAFAGSGRAVDQSSPLPTPAAAETVTSPTTVATPARSAGTPFQRSGALDQIEVRKLIEQHFQGEEVNRAMRVAWCESGFNPSLVDPTTGATGLFPIDPDTWRRLAGASDPTDPERNVRVAAMIVAERGWTYWACRG
jgi:soluble lytic murein transglycosylase-like protein